MAEFVQRQDNSQRGICAESRMQIEGKYDKGGYLQGLISNDTPAPPPLFEPCTSFHYVSVT